MKRTTFYRIATPRRVHRLASIVLGLCFAAANAQAQVYQVTELGVIPGKKESTPTAINDRGQVVGFSMAGPATESAFRYNNSKRAALEDLGKNPEGSITRAFGINPSGQVVGDSTFGGSDSISRAALFSNGSSADLGTLKEAGAYSRANGVNASGQVVGFAGPELDSKETRAFYWSASTGMVDLDTLGGAFAQATAINDSGFITGHSQIGVRESGKIHAFIYQPFPLFAIATKVMRDLGTLGGAFSYGTAINANNHVVGYSTLNESDGRFHAFLYDGVEMHDLGSLAAKFVGSDQSFALGVNDADQVVGYTYSTPDQVGFIYSKGVMSNLNELIGGAAKDYLIYAATAINNNGQIVASAFSYRNNVLRAVLLTPIKAK